MIIILNLFKLIATCGTSTQFKAGNKEIVDRNVYTYAFQNGLYLENFVSGYMSEKRFKHTCSVAKLAREFAVENGIDGKKHILQECCMILPKKWIKNKKMI